MKERTRTKEQYEEKVGEAFCVRTSNIPNQTMTGSEIRCIAESDERVIEREQGAIAEGAYRYRETEQYKKQLGSLLHTV